LEPDQDRNEGGFVSLSTRLERGDVLSAACPSREVLRNVTSRWGTLVLLALTTGTLRFSDLRRRATGISEKMLAQTLQTLEADGFVLRTAYPTVPPKVEYTLTPLGQEVASRVGGIADWIESNIATILRSRERLRDAP
jgi:DNA-binding HxlR family transcriptional regulator